MGRRKQLTTSLDEELLKRAKKLAVDVDRRLNELLEEGLRLRMAIQASEEDWKHFWEEWKKKYQPIWEELKKKKDEPSEDA